MFAMELELIKLEPQLMAKQQVMEAMVVPMRKLIQQTSVLTRLLSDQVVSLIALHSMDSTPTAITPINQNNSVGMVVQYME